MKKKKYIQFDDGSAVLKKERKVSIKELVISLLLAVMLFIGLILVEGKLLSNYETTKVVTAIGTIPVGTQITDSNVNSYFKITEIPAKIKPSYAITDTDSLIGKIVSGSITEGEIVVEERFSSEEDYLKNVKNPIEIGIDISDVSQIVGGIIRKGDIINISVVDSSTNENVTVLNNVYVSKVFDSNNLEIIGSSPDSVAQFLNVYIADEDEQYFNETLARGTVSISKVLSPTAKNNVYGTNNQLQTSGVMETESN